MQRFTLSLIICLFFSIVTSAQLYKQDKKYQEKEQSDSTSNEGGKGDAKKKTYKKENEKNKSKTTTIKKPAPKPKPMTNAEKKKLEKEEAEREAARPKGIELYYYHFPKEDLPVVTEFMEAKQIENPHLKLRDDSLIRKEIIRYKNIDKGYIELQKPGDTKKTKMQVFKKSNGNLVMAVEESDCQNAFCKGSLKFYTASAGGWKESTDEYYPQIDTKNVISMLKSRYKKEYKDLELYNAKGYEDNEENLKKALIYTIAPDEGKILIQEQYLPTTLYEMIWDGKKDKFELKKVER